MDGHAQPRTVTPLVIPEIISLPAEIDATSAGWVSQQLHAAGGCDVAAVIADGTRTTFCDCSGARALLRGHQAAASAGTQLRVVLHGGALRVLQILDFDRLLLIYPDLQAALSAAPVRSAREGPGGPGVLSR